MEEFDQGKALQEYEDWEESPQGILYSLRIDSDSVELETLIVETVLRLGTDVRQYLYDECLFVSVGAGIHGRVIAPSLRWIILLDASIVTTYDTEEAMSIIAHEIAHAWLQHDHTSPIITSQCEIDTARLTEKWGFKGIGANVERMRQIYQIQ